MSPEKKPTRKPGKPVAEEPSAQEKIIQFWKDYQVPIVAGLLILIAAGILVTWIGRARAENEQAAAMRLNVAASFYQQTVLQPPTETSQSEDQLNRAIAQCDEVRADYPKLEAAHLALFIRGNCNYELAYLQIQTGQRQRALELLDNAANDFREYMNEAKSKDDRAEAMIALAACFENRAFFSNDNQMMQAAINQLQEAATLGEGTYLQAQALSNMARCNEALGRRDAAAEIYARIQRLRPAIGRQRAVGGVGLQTPGGFSELATERLERIRSGIDAPQT
jgi:tetratricopeptide (TPR) repeat protein